MLSVLNAKGTLVAIEGRRKAARADKNWENSELKSMAAIAVNI